MRILSVDKRPFHEVVYRSVASSGVVEHRRFPLLRGTADTLPDGCDAVFACSDLQGMTIHDVDGKKVYRQLGVTVAEELVRLCGKTTIPEAARIGIFLCGDLYVRPTLDRRGGIGDVRPVWSAFARSFRWVAGVAGNHDEFGHNKADLSTFCSEPGVHVLDGRVVGLDGLQVAGLGGIIGDPKKKQRRKEKDFVRALKDLLVKDPDVVLLHQGPDVPALDLGGHEAVRKAMHKVTRPLVLCGHVHWKTPVITTPEQLQILNLEARGLLLTRTCVP